MGVNSFQQAKQRLVDVVKSTKASLDYDVSAGYQGVNDPLAARLGIVVEERSLSFDFGAYLPATPPTRPRPVIWLDTTAASNEHLNFSYYHEISHHLIRNDDELYAFLSDAANRNDDFDSIVDHFANIGAAEFLIPSEVIFSYQKEHGFSIQLLPQLAEHYPASKPAIAIQMAQCALHRCFVVVCEFGVLPNRSVEQSELVIEVGYSNPCLYIQYASNSPSQERYKIGKYSVISENHILHHAYESKNYVKGYDSIPFKSKKVWKVNCEALYYEGRVFGVFNTSTPNNPTTLQPSLF